MLFLFNLNLPKCRILNKLCLDLIYTFLLTPSSTTKPLTSPIHISLELHYTIYNWHLLQTIRYCNAFWLLTVNKLSDMKKDTQVKVLVVGDSGVGKSQLVNVLTSRYKSNQSKWTIGVNIEVAVHVYHPASDEATYLVELWDISGNQAHKNSRSVFYRGTYCLVITFVQ